MTENEKVILHGLSANLAKVKKMSKSNIITNEKLVKIEKYNSGMCFPHSFFRKISKMEGLD